MKQLTIRGVDEKLHKTLQNKADQHGVSMNRYVLHLIKESVGLAASSLPEPEFDDLDDLAGTWTEAEYAEFTSSLAGQRQIDAEMWS